MIFQSVAQAAQKEKNPLTPNKSRTYDLLVTSPDALPLKATGEWWELRPLN